jgi:cyclic dehypoxanthinyl futalosine synthase
LSCFDAAKRLLLAGNRWITGGGAEILTDRFRKAHSPQKYSVDEFYDAQQAILEAGCQSTATMVIGFDESPEERLTHLLRLRSFQDQMKGGLFSFLTWTYKPYHTVLGGQEVDAETYWRHLALCRLMLDNFSMLRTSVLTQNENALLGLKFGANDFDLPLEDEVTEKAGAHIERDLAIILQQSRKAGFEPKFRTIARDSQSPLRLAFQGVGGKA